MILPDAHLPVYERYPEYFTVVRKTQGGGKGVMVTGRCRLIIKWNGAEHFAMEQGNGWKTFNFASKRNGKQKRQGDYCKTKYVYGNKMGTFSLFWFPTSRVARST